jgi:hypothetical protein
MIFSEARKEFPSSNNPNCGESRRGIMIKTAISTGE